jgi:replicative DNA helicase
MKRHPDNPLPSNVSAEKAIIGAVLLDNGLWDAVRSLEPEDFSLDSHRLIFQHIGEMLERGEAADPVTLVEEMRTTKTLEKVGELPVSYISSLSEDTIRYRPAVKDWARIVKAKSLHRRLIGLCNAATEKCYEGERGGAIISFLRENLDDIEACANRGLRAKEVVE